MEELVQALEISQLHVSLEKISTFLEKKDSDDLKQSSDKETTSHSKRKAFDLTSKRTSKHRKFEQCSSATQKSEQCSSAKKKTEQCGSPFDPSVNDFLESSENEDQTNDSTEDLCISTPVFNDDECLGPKAWFPYRRICRVCRTKKNHRTDTIHSISYNKLYLSRTTSCICRIENLYGKFP